MTLGTTILIQKNQAKGGKYESRDIKDFSELEQEIMKIKTESQRRIKIVYKSENRTEDKGTSTGQVFTYSKQQKGKPPLKSPTSNEAKASGIPRIGERKTPVKNMNDRKREAVAFGTSLKVPQARRNPDDYPGSFSSMAKLKSKGAIRGKRITSDASDNDLNSTLNKKSAQTSTKNPYPSYKVDDLIQKKRDALGIKPLDSSLSNYKTVLRENQKLKKNIEELKVCIKKLRQERIEQVKAIEQHKENEK